MHGSRPRNVEKGLFTMFTKCGPAWSQAFVEYASFHRRCRSDPGCLSKALIWQCGKHDSCGGLGDEIRGLVFTFYVAMITKRPFFVRWHRMGQNMLEFFEINGIDVHPPVEVPLACPVRTSLFFDVNAKADMSALVKEAAASTGCDTWVTNVCIMWFVKLVQGMLPALKALRPDFFIGCAMNFMFNPMALTNEDLANFDDKLPAKFTAIHLRCEDKAMVAGGSPRADEAHRVERSLQCAKKIGAESVAFVTCSETAKVLAKEEAQKLGLRVLTSRRQARHIDFDHQNLSSRALRGALWSDFVMLQHADSLVFGTFEGFSGFAKIASSMGLLSSDELMYLTRDSSICRSVR